jgi:hypothetical protein
MRKYKQLSKRYRIHGGRDYTVELKSRLARKPVKIHITYLIVCHIRSTKKQLFVELPSGYVGIHSLDSRRTYIPYECNMENDIYVGQGMYTIQHNTMRPRIAYR